MELENTWLIEHQNKINHRWWWPETKLLQWWPETSCSISGPELSCYNSLTLSDSCPTSHHSQIHAYVDSNEVRSLSMMSPVSKMVMSIYYINPRLFRPCLIDTIGVFISVWDTFSLFTHINPNPWKFVHANYSSHVTQGWRALDVLLAAVELWHCCITSSLSKASFLTLSAYFLPISYHLRFVKRTSMSCWLRDEMPAQSCGPGDRTVN